MPKARHVLVATAAALSISMLPVQFDKLSFDGTFAHAKDGNNGGGGGNGSDRGGGQSANGGGGHGKSAGNDGKGQASVERSSGKSGGGLLKSLLRGNSGKSAATSAAKGSSNGKKSHKAAPVELPETAVLPADKPKNLHARLGGLNSLKRNANAYLNSNSPRFAAIFAYVIGSAESQLAAEALQAAQEKLAAAVGAIVPYDASAPLPDSELATLQGRLDALNAIDPTTVLPAQQAAFEAEKAALQAAIQAANELAAAEEAAAGAVAPDAAALEDALEAAANPNREIDQEIIDWATEVLEGKIAEVKEILAAEAAEAPVAPVTEPVAP